MALDDQTSVPVGEFALRATTVTPPVKPSSYWTDCVRVYDQAPVPAFQAQVLDVRAGGLGHAQPVERQQGDQRVLGRRPEPGGDQERAELVAVQGGRVRFVVQPGTADVRRRRVVQEFFLDGVLSC